VAGGSRGGKVDGRGSTLKSAPHRHNSARLAEVTMGQTLQNPRRWRS
jgi:hypothetical protein